MPIKKHIFALMRAKADNKSLIYTEVIVLIFIWILIFAGPFLFLDDDRTFEWSHFINSWLNLLPFFALTLINHFILVPYIFFRTNKWLYFLIALLSAVTFVMLNKTFHNIQKEGMEEVRNRPLPPRNQPPHFRDSKPFPPHMRPDEGESRAPNSLPPLTNMFLISILALGFDTGLRTVFRWIKLEKERDEIEKESVQNELAFLRNQVSPHFFMNMLNNIHALIDIDTEEAKGSVIRLSQLMRHLLYESETEKIQLSKELDFIRNYVDLMRLRFSSKVQIDVSISENIPDTTIPPLLFTSYLENAFKHGVSYRDKSFIHLKIDITNSDLTFILKNSNHQLVALNNQSGIGVENSRKRLDLLFADKYDLTTEETSDQYLVKLNIPL